MFEAKLCKPYTGRNIIRRKKLDDIFHMLPDCRLALISAPAGYGKTTAVVDYLNSEVIQYAWFSIDAEDNDPIRFWRYLLSAISRCVKNDDIGLISLDSELISSNMTVDLLISMIEAVREEFVIVLDDYHLINNSVILNSIEHFIKYMPRKASLIILSRNEPENMLSVLRARGRAISLGIKDLCFDRNEIADFFYKMGFILTEEELLKIQLGTEGWAAGLVAASFSIMEFESVSKAISTFSEKDKNINKILENEIFDHWSDEIKEFLIHTSFLEKLSGPICRAVTGNKNSAGLLRLLSNSNSFIIPLDTESRWFRYHHLFQGFLLSRLELKGEEAVRQLYRLAGEWYLANGSPVEGIDWLLKAGEYAKTLPYILNIRMETVQEYEFLQWNKWIDSIPEKFYENDISVYTSYSWVASMDNKIDAARDWTEKARACLNRIKDSMDEKYRNLMEATVIMSEMNVSLLNMDIAETRLHFNKLIKLELQIPVRLGELNWNEPSLLKTAYGFKGRLEKVKEYLPVIHKLPDLIGNFSLYFSVIIAEAYYEQNMLKELSTIMIKNMSLIAEISKPGIILPSFIILSKEKLAKGDIAGAFRAINEAEKLLAGKTGSVWYYNLVIFEAKLYMSLGDFDRAVKLINTEKLGVYDKLSCVREAEYIVFARYLMGIKHLEDALILLKRLENFARKESRLGSLIEIICLSAICYGMKGDYKSALEVLEQALALGNEEIYMRTFIDEQEPMAALLDKYIAVNRNGYRNKYLTYAKSLFRCTNEFIRILKSAEGTIGETGQNREDYTGSLLSKREVEILKLLAIKQSNEEIAKELFVSLSTIKQHNSRIFDKLGVKNRHEAIIRARTLQIIE